MALLFVFVEFDGLKLFPGLDHSATQARHLLVPLPIKLRNSNAMQHARIQPRGRAGFHKPGMYRVTTEPAPRAYRPMAVPQTTVQLAPSEAPLRQGGLVFVFARDMAA
jgi:hypothetical protein